MREAVAQDIFNRRRVTINPEEIVIVPGGKVTMWHAILMFGGKGKEIIYPKKKLSLSYWSLKIIDKGPVKQSNPVPIRHQSD